MSRSIRREDPAYLAAMREAKELFDAEMAKSAMRSRGRSAARPVVNTKDAPEEMDEMDGEMPEEIAAAIAAQEPATPKVESKDAAAKAPVRRRSRRAVAAAAR